MKIQEIASDTSVAGLTALLETLHKEGPISQDILEALSYYKEFHHEIFSGYEEQVVAALGLFYKVKSHRNLYSFLLSGIGEQYRKLYGAKLTPVQASVRSAIDDKRIVSISAPTSAGKSYSIRDFIAEQEGDAVVVVPSRALIAEYMNAMRRRFDGNKKVMISAFVDDVFTSRALRHIFVLTPERAREIFSFPGKFNISVFSLDEAQISEDKERGVLFDVLVRRVQKTFSSAKIIFAHPFVQNPEAQLKKHGFPEDDAYSRSYTYGTVGKICVFQHSNNKSYYFSPFIDKGHQLRNCREFPLKFGDFAFNGSHSVLVYVSKSSIYSGRFLEEFNRYIKAFPEVEDEEAVNIIDTISHLLGADQEGHDSRLVQLMRKGVVIHHGSVPLEVRFLVEEFIRKGFARICFATSTLAQGVNMPFDIVWLENMRFLGDTEGGRALAFKNLIGRAGRLSDFSKFDYGYVFTKSPKLFSLRIKEEFRLDERSVIDIPIEELEDDASELIESIKSGTFDEDKQVPLSKVERLSRNEVIEACRIILGHVYQQASIKESIGGAENRGLRAELKDRFQTIFEMSLNRTLKEGEAAVFDQAIRIFLHVIQGRSFREIVAIRYSHIARRDEKHKGFARFSQPAERLPKSTLVNVFSIFKKDKLAKDVSYDAIVFDTYDYLDQVMSFSLSDTFIAAFKVYKDVTNDERADKMMELIRFGTNDSVHTLLMRYGFPPEDVSEISRYVLSISEEDIVFKAEIENAPRYILDLVEWYRP